LLIGLAVATASAQTEPIGGGAGPTTGGPSRDGIVFPVVGKVSYADDFGDPRPGRSQQG